MKIIEVNPNTSKGSYGKGLNLARLWSLINLKKVKTDFDTIYIVILVSCFIYCESIFLLIKSLMLKVIKKD
jgi:hypothetical protein